MKFHITITDNETGKVLDEADTNAIIGGYQYGTGANAIGLTCCSDHELATPLLAAEESVRRIKKQKGLLFTALVDLLASSFETEDKSAELRKKSEES